jgi:putative hydrolase of the HAD superfamily
MVGSVISLDAAGTLIYPRVSVGQTYAEVGLRHGLTVEVEAVKAAFRSVWSSLPAPVWPEGACSPDDDRGWWQGLVGAVFQEATGQVITPEILEPLFAELYGHFAQPEAWSVYDDVRPALEYLAQDHRLCVLSNFDQRLRSILIGHDLAGFFEQIILSSEVGASKPHRRMFENALFQMQETSWHVGDDVRCDLQGATALGWRAFLLERPTTNLSHFVKKVRFILK